MSLYDNFNDEPWHRRSVWRIGRFLQKTPHLSCKVIVSALILFILYCLVSYFTGGTDAERALYEAGTHYMESPHRVANYKWRNKLADETIGLHVIKARSGINYSNVLELIGAQADDAAAELVRCSDFFGAKSASLSAVMFAARQYLLANLNGPACVCGPQLGYNVRFIALRQRRATGATVAVRDADGDNASIEVLPDDQAVLMAFNPVDEHQTAYDALDGDFLKLHHVNLAVIDAGQDYRYNVRRGMFRIVRRERVRLSMIDKSCHRERVTLTKDLALCAEECLDLMRGIDVRERALLQHRSGLSLNAAYFATIVEQKLADDTNKAKTEL